MTDLRAMSDDELEALKERGEEAAGILDERERAATRARRALMPLTPGLIVGMLGGYALTTDRQGALREEYRGFPLTELLAAHPIPPGMMATPENARAMLAIWDAYMYERRMQHE